jgi:hypothetical protein
MTRLHLIAIALLVVAWLATIIFMVWHRRS